MTNRGGKGLRALVPCLRGGWLILVLVLVLVPLACLAAGKAGATDDEIVRGERIYREGILPSGERLRVAMKEGNTLPGLTFPCASCHLRSGLGSYDEGVYTPPINGGKLFRPLPRVYKGITQEEELRPAYTDRTLAEVLRTGRDPNGRLLSDAMPRYVFNDEELRLLTAYLRALSAEFSPGVTDTGIRFATVLSEEVPQENRDAVLAALDSYFTLKNNQIRSFENPRNAKSRLMSENMMLSRELTGKSLFLSRWILKGAPETWRSQLDEYNRKDPVFALLGGVVGGPWEPVHRFCEENRIPCLFPNTDLPVISESDWYTLYQSKGYYQEGEGAARFLSERDPVKGAVVQLVRESAEGKALAAGFQKTWQELGQPAPVTVTLPRGGSLDREFLKKLVARDKPAVLLLWDGPSALPALESLPGLAQRPQMVFLSARYLGQEIWSLKEPVRSFSYLTYPYAFSVKLKQAGMSKFIVLDDLQPTLKRSEVTAKSEAQKLVNQTNALTQLLTGILMDLKGNYYRDNVMDVAGMMPDQPHQLYGRISFATGQRYASKGCFVVQLSQGAAPELVKRSGWLAH